MTREGRKNNDEEGKPERAGCSLTPARVVAAAAVIFPSGGRVTLAWARTGDGEWEAAGPGLCWRELPQVKVTGAGSCSPGAPDTPQQLPLRDAASAHLFTGSGNKKISEAQRTSVSFLSHHAATLFCYSLMWKIVRGIKYWCDLMCLILHFAVRVQVLSGSISQKCTWRKVLDLQRSAFDLLSKRKIFPFHYWASYYSLYYLMRHTKISLSSPLCFFPSLVFFFLPGWHPSPCGSPAHLWQLCQCKLLQSVWAQGERYLQGCPSLAHKDPE